METTYYQSMPLDLGTALLQNEAALQRFSTLSEREQKALVSQAREMNSGYELRQLVRGIASL